MRIGDLVMAVSTGRDNEVSADTRWVGIVIGFEMLKMVPSSDDIVPIVYWDSLNTESPEFADQLIVINERQKA